MKKTINAKEEQPALFFTVPIGKRRIGKAVLSEEFYKHQVSAAIPDLDKPKKLKLLKVRPGD